MYFFILPATPTSTGMQCVENSFRYWLVKDEIFPNDISLGQDSLVNDHFKLVADKDAVTIENKAIHNIVSEENRLNAPKFQ